MATVVYQPRDTRAAEFGAAMAQGGAAIFNAMAKKKKDNAASAALEGLASGEATPEQASAALYKAGFSADEVNKALAPTYEKARQDSVNAVQTRGQDLGHEQAGWTRDAKIKELGLTERGQNIQQEVAQGQLKLGYAEMSAANQRSREEIASRQKLLGAELSAQEQQQIRQHNFDLERTALEAKNNRDNTILQGAIQSQLGKENSTSRISEIIASGNVQGWLQNDAQKFEAGEASKNRDMTTGIALMEQEGQNARLDRQLTVEERMQGKQIGSNEKINSANIQAQHIDRTVTEAGLRSRLNSQLAQDTFNTIMGQNFSEKTQKSQQQFQAEQGALDRKTQLDIAAERGNTATQKEKDAQDTANMLSAAADSMGMKLDPSSDKGKYLAKEYQSSSKPILQAYTKQLGIDVKTMTPDGFMSKFDGSKVGGLDRMKLEVGSKMLPHLYVTEAQKDSPNVTQGNIQSQLMSGVDEAMRNPATVLPQNMLTPEGQLKVKPGDAVKYLVETKGFTKEDVRRWSSMIGAPLDDTMLNSVYPWSE